jgi:hypothetical protein
MQVELNFMVTNIGASALRLSASRLLHGLY